VVLILGCGALGAPIAEHCLRGGARKLILVDNKRVTPGVLIRQPYDDADIGHLKAETLARRLSYAGFHTEVVSWVADAMDVITADNAPDDVDLIIDATANQTVAAMIELKRWTGAFAWPPILTVSIGHNAERGFAGLALPGATGAGADLIRKLALAAHAEPGLSGVADDFFPEQPRADVFVPEPGCSQATFRGSATEVQALAAYLFAGAMSDLRAAEEAAEAARVPSMTARVVQLANAAGDNNLAGTAELAWLPDMIIDPNMTIDDVKGDSEGQGYQIRISQTALADMRDEACLTRETKGPNVETGGTLFGQFDAAAHVVWVTSATGPALDSVQSEAEYEYGTRGVSDLRNLLRTFSAGRLRFVGMWHTHPGGAAWPSDIDKETMQGPARSVGEMPPRSLFVIVGGAAAQWNGWLDSDGRPQIYARLIDRGVVAR
jgi:predicted ThiF/HesA family dinucleotide-utilizing enzyme/proteasome lid subunit RPN8/RPN11